MLVAKIGDVAPGTCVCVVPPVTPFPATGVVMSSSSIISSSGIPLALAGISIVVFPCGTSIIVPSGVSFTTSGTPLAKTGDSVTGCGIGTLIGTTNITSL